MCCSKSRKSSQLAHGVGMCSSPCWPQHSVSLWIRMFFILITHRRPETFQGTQAHFGNRFLFLNNFFFGEIKFSARRKLSTLWMCNGLIKIKAPAKMRQKLKWHAEIAQIFWWTLFAGFYWIVGKGDHLQIHASSYRLLKRMPNKWMKIDVKFRIRTMFHY